MCILMGKNFYRDCKLVGEETVKLELWEKYCSELSNRKQRITSRLANHRQLVDTMVGRSVPGESMKREMVESEALIADGQLMVAGAADHGATPNRVVAVQAWLRKSAPKAGCCPPRLRLGMRLVVGQH